MKSTKKAMPKMDSWKTTTLPLRKRHMLTAVLVSLVSLMVLWTSLSGNIRKTGPQAAGRISEGLSNAEGSGSPPSIDEWLAQFYKIKGNGIWGAEMDNYEPAPMKDLEYMPDHLHH